jgi:hypothetical protein
MARGKPLKRGSSKAARAGRKGGKGSRPSLRKGPGRQRKTPKR